MNKKLFFLTLVLIIVFSLTFFYLFERIIKLESKVENLSVREFSESQAITDSSGSSLREGSDGCGDNCRKVVNDIVSKAISTVSGKTKVVETKTASSIAPKTSYIPMGTTYTTTSTDWHTIDDTGIYIDLVNEYGKNATVSWEAQLKVAHGNGQAFARLWDDTNKIAVNGSELTTLNNSSYLLVSTGDIPFWKGRNLYKVQIKSLNSFEVSYTGGKIRISY